MGNHSRTPVCVFQVLRICVHIGLAKNMLLAISYAYTPAWMQVLLYSELVYLHSALDLDDSIDNITTHVTVHSTVALTRLMNCVHITRMNGGWGCQSTSRFMASRPVHFGLLRSPGVIVSIGACVCVCCLFVFTHSWRAYHFQLSGQLCLIFFCPSERLHFNLHFRQFLSLHDSTGALHDMMSAGMCVASFWDFDEVMCHRANIA